MNLTRWDNADIMNYLCTSYEGNQLTKVTDNGCSPIDYSEKRYQDGADAPKEMFYDKNGNLIADFDRKICAIRYNVLSLPDTIQFSNGNQIVHTYDAMGNRLRTTYYTRKVALVEPATNTIPGTDNLQEYNIASYTMLGNSRYKQFNHCDWSFDMIMNSEGFMKYFSPEERYPYYFIKDHLGNVREAWIRPSLNEKYLEQRMQYYPSGLPWNENVLPGNQPFKYGGKEFVEMHGLDEYDSQARWYYPAIMRTTTMDPMCEKYYSISPYAWCGNNPVNYIDPDGMDWYFTVDSAGKKTYQYSEDITSQHDLDVQQIDGQYVGMTYTSNQFYLGLFGNHAELETREAILLKQIDELILKEIDYSFELNASLIGSEAPTSPRLRFIVPGVDKEGMEFTYAGGKGVYKQVQNNRGYIEQKLEEKRRNGGWFSWTYAYFLIIQNNERYDFLRVQFSDEAAESFKRQYDKYYNRRKSSY